MSFLSSSNLHFLQLVENVAGVSTERFCVQDGRKKALVAEGVSKEKQICTLRSKLSNVEEPFHEIHAAWTTEVKTK